VVEGKNTQLRKAKFGKSRLQPASNLSGPKELLNSKSIRFKTKTVNKVEEKAQSSKEKRRRSCKQLRIAFHDHFDEEEACSWGYWRRLRN
jgi:hypothetical protein